MTQCLAASASLDGASTWYAPPNRGGAGGYGDIESPSEASTRVHRARRGVGGGTASAGARPAQAGAGSWRRRARTKRAWRHSGAGSYQCSTEKTDFQEALHAPIAAALRRPDIGNDPDGAVARFERAIEDARNTREGIDDEDEDLVVTQAGGAGGYQPPNSKCAISGIAVEAIEDPVEDEKGYVYEKAAIEQYVRSHTGRGRGDTCSCPHAGTSHQISMQSCGPRKTSRAGEKSRRVAASRRASEGGDDDEDVVLTSP